MTKTNTSFIHAIHRTLLKIFEANIKQGGDYSNFGHVDSLAESIADSVDTGSDTGNIGELASQGSVRQLLHKSRLDERLLRLLMQMSMGMEEAIQELIKELKGDVNPALIKAIALSMEKGIEGAERVLRTMLDSSLSQGSEHSARIKQIIGKVSPQVEEQLAKKPFHPKPTMMPKDLKDPFSS